VAVSLGDSNTRRLEALDRFGNLVVKAIQQMRDRNMLAGLSFDAPLRVLDLAEHYHATADALEKCGRLLCTLKIQHYWEDYGL
jgi:hypothetical protein